MRVPLRSNHPAPLPSRPASRRSLPSYRIPQSQRRLHAFPRRLPLLSSSLRPSRPISRRRHRLSASSSITRDQHPRAAQTLRLLLSLAVLLPANRLALALPRCTAATSRMAVTQSRAQPLRQAAPSALSVDACHRTSRPLLLLDQTMASCPSVVRRPRDPPLKMSTVLASSNARHRQRPKRQREVAI